MGRRNDAEWLKFFALCKQYIAEHDGAIPGQKAVVNGHKIGTWFNTQSALFRRGDMFEDRRELWAAFEETFTRAAPGWPRDDARWMEQFSAYQRYFELYHRFPGLSTVFEGEHIGKWLHNQAGALRSGILSEDRLALLDSLHPAWKEGYDVKVMVETEMLLASDWRSKVPQGDICIDSALDGDSLRACVVHGIYGCRQYLEAYASSRGDTAGAFRDPFIDKISHKRYGAEMFSWESRRDVFHAVFPRLHFNGFQIITMALGIERNTPFLAWAEEYNRRCPFASREDMVEHIDGLLKTLKGQESDVLVRRFCLGETQAEVAEHYGRVPQRIYQIEHRGVLKMQHPGRTHGLEPLGDISLLLAGRPDDVLPGTHLEVPKGADCVHLEGSACCGLPQGLIVHGTLNVQHTPLEALPAGMVVQGDLLLCGSFIEHLPDDLVVHGDLYLPATVMEVPEAVRVDGEIVWEYVESFWQDEALASIRTLGLPEEAVKALERKGVYTVMDLRDLQLHDSSLVGRDSHEPFWGI